MAVGGRGRLRLIVEGPEPLVIERDGTDPEKPGADGGERHPRASVRAIPDSTASKAASQQHYEAVVAGWVFPISVESADRARLRERAARAAVEVGRHVGVTVRAQIPGRVVRVWVEPGEAVEIGQRLLAVEAMKMENEVRAPRAGVVGKLPVAIGQTVELGDELVTLE